MKDRVDESGWRVGHQKIHPARTFESRDILHRHLLIRPPVHAIATHNPVDEGIAATQESDTPPIKLKHGSPRDEYEVGCHLGRLSDSPIARLVVVISGYVIDRTT
jgi:hypothetical protein